ncbi:MAG: TIR domain-containing protein [Acetatifactor sp.]|nr:TIR domain-containing protein [Acetatifactor sp.]
MSSELDVFISYSTKNKSVADAIVSNFENNGIRCWYAPRDIMPGQEWVSSIKDALKAAKVFVLIFTAESNLSRQVMNEVALAFNAGMTIVPFRLTEEMMNDELEYYLTRVHWLDAVSKPLENSIESLRSYVEVILQGGARRETQMSIHTEKAKEPKLSYVPENPSDMTKATSKKKAIDKKKLGLIIGIVAAALVLLVCGVVIFTRPKSLGKDELMAEGYQALYYGLYGSEDNAKARENYEKAADKGVADAYYYLGVLNEREYDYKAAKEAYEQGIDAGSNLALLGMGSLWQRGLCGEANMEKAWKLYNEALDNGCVEADFYRAQIIDGGFAGQKADATKAVKLYKNVIEESKLSHFVANAYNNLGTIYRNGRLDIPKDAEEALKMYRAVAETIDSKSSQETCDYNSGLVYKDREEMVKADDLFRSAFEISKERAEAGSIYSMYWTGHCYHYGNGVTQSYQEAVRWFQAANDAAKERNEKTRCHVALVELGDLCQNEEFGIDYEKAYEYYKEASDYGYGNAARKIGDLYYYGHRGQDADGNSDYQLARQWYDKAIEHGCTDAYQSIGSIYFEIMDDEEKALEYYQKGAALGSGACAYNIGRIYYNEFKNEEALKWFQKAADLEAKEAYVWLGILYTEKKDEELSIAYYKKAANAGIDLAMQFLTDDYYNGNYSTGVSYEEAFAWAQKGAELKNTYCMYMLGRMYYEGNGTEKNLPEAATWLLKAAEAGDEEAARLYGSLMLYGGDGLAANSAEGVRWLKKFADQGQISAVRELAEFYYDQKDYKNAFSYYNQLYNLGVTNASVYYALGWMYYYGKGTDKDDQQAFYWLVKASDAGQILEAEEAKFVALAYYRGTYSEVSYAKSFPHMKVAAEGGLAIPMEYLGYYYRFGITDNNFLKPDPKMALTWYGKALDTGDLPSDHVTFCKTQIQNMVDCGEITAQDAAKWLN